MNVKQMLSLKEVNYWYLASAIALNIFWTLAMAFFVSLLFLQESEGEPIFIQLGLMVAAFLGPFLTASLIANIAADGRGLTYGLYGAIASAVLLFILAVPSTGLLGIMLMIVALSGGLNGGLMAARRK